jgi:hypothetical protein
MAQHREGASHIPRGARLSYISLFYATHLIVVTRSTHHTAYLHRDSASTGGKNAPPGAAARPRQYTKVTGRGGLALAERRRAKGERENEMSVAESVVRLSATRATGRCLAH